MAKATKKTNETEPRKRSAHRSPEQMIADYETKIAQVRARAAARQAKADPAAKALILAAKTLDRALVTANAHKATQIARALEAGRAPLSTALVEQGIRLPDPGKTRGRKPAAA